MGIISRKWEFWTKLGVFPSSKIKFLPVAVPGRLRYEANEELRAGYARLCYSWLCPWWLLHSGFCFVFFFSCPQHKYYMFFDLHWTPVVNTGGRQAGSVPGGLGAGQRHHFSLVDWACLLSWSCVWVLTFCNRCFHCHIQQALSLLSGGVPPLLSLFPSSERGRWGWVSPCPGLLLFHLLSWLVAGRGPWLALFAQVCMNRVVACYEF